MKLIEYINSKILKRNIEKHKSDIRSRYDNGDITIISNNCLAGVIYNILGIQFCSPTINQWMKMADYLEFVKDLKYWMTCALVEDLEETKKWEFPVGYLQSGIDINKRVYLYMNHYHSFEDGKAKWEERKKRIIWDKLYVIYDFNDKDCDINMLYEFDKLPIKNKIAIVHSEISNLGNSYQMKCIGKDDPITKEFEFDGLTGKRYFEEWDYISFLNCF